jgi:hypothetical protein
MMNILTIPNGVIIAIGSYTETETEFVYSGLIVPKVAVSGYAFYNVTLPTDYVDGKYLYKNNAFVVNSNWPGFSEIQSQNVTEAQSLLTATDWASIPAVADPAQSNPYLTNQAAFLEYRSQVRDIAVNPPTTVAVFPTQPTEQWSN